jgi:hypothetical protein
MQAARNAVAYEAAGLAVDLARAIGLLASVAWVLAR